MAKQQLFLLSPAKVTGQRAKILLRDEATFDLATRLRRQGAELGEVFSFMSGLYFRGKLAYARTFAASPPGVPGTLIITSGRGLLPPECRVTRQDIQSFSSVSIDVADKTYHNALTRDAKLLASVIGHDCAVVLLGSIATPKYVDPLLDVFGERLLFPVDFVGRGDLSRGGLVLRTSRTGVELPYVQVEGSARRGQRPARLSRLQSR